MGDPWPNCMYREKSRDGGTEGHRAPLLPQIQPKYIPTWNSSQRIPHWTLAEDTRHPKVQERAPRNQLGQKQKDKKGIRTGPAPPGGSWKGGKVPPPWEAPSRAGTLAGTQGEPRRLGGERGGQLAAARTEREPHGGSAPPPVVPSPRPEAAATCGAGG